jgi:hypothetical protein
VTDCAVRHGPTIDVYATSAHHMAALFDSPLLQPATFGVSERRAVQVIFPVLKIRPVPARPLNLTHCVQLK